MSERVVVLLQNNNRLHMYEYNKYNHVDLTILSKEAQIRALDQMLQVAQSSEEYPNASIHCCAKSNKGIDIIYAITMKNSELDKLARENEQ